MIKLITHKTRDKKNKRIRVKVCDQSPKYAPIAVGYIPTRVSTKLIKLMAIVLKLNCNLFKTIDNYA